MTLDVAEHMMLELMDEHGLIDKGWIFEFDRAVRRFGCCHHSEMKLTLSRHLVELNDEFHVKNTMLHEIAHALVPARHGHDKVWRAKAIEIGCNGNRCYSPEVIRPNKWTHRNVKRWVGVCPNPDCDYRTRERSRRGDLACSRCCRLYNRGRYDPRYKFTWEEAGVSRIYSISMPVTVNQKAVELLRTQLANNETGK